MTRSLRVFMVNVEMEVVVNKLVTIYIESLNVVFESEDIDDRIHHNDMRVEVEVSICPSTWYSSMLSS